MASTVPFNQSDAMKQTLRSFKIQVQKMLGMKISDREVLELYKKYGSGSAGKNYNETMSRDVSNVRTTVSNAYKKGTLHDASIDCSEFTLEKLFDVMNHQIMVKTSSSLGDHRVNMAYTMFSDGKNSADGKNSYLSRQQLKSKLRDKLGLLCPDNLIELIFKAMDPQNTGVIKTRHFVMSVVNSYTRNTQPSIKMVPEHGENGEFKLQKEREPYATYEGKFLYLAPPPKANLEQVREPYKVEHLEQAICDHVVQRTGRGTTLVQTLVKCFGDTRIDKSEANAGITRDQVKYSLWTRFQMRVTEDEIDLLFKKYDKNNTGLLPLHPFVEGIIKNHAMSKALMEEAEVEGSYADDPQHRQDDDLIDRLLGIVKNCIIRSVSREARAPHYILHSSTRMRLDQFKAFIVQKLQVPTKEVDTVVRLAVRHYFKDSLVDVRKMLYDAMSFQAAGEHSGLSAKQRKNRIIVATEMPSALKEIKYTPEKIQDMLVLKINERAKNNNPLSTLHKLFKDGSVVATKTVDREKIRGLLRRFDILLCEKDFDSFFKSHDRGDGLIDIRKFLLKLIPQPDYANNPLAPKAPAVVSTELQLARELASLTGRKREVSSINGVSSIRFEKISPFGDGETIIDKSSPDRPMSAYDISGNKIKNYKEYIPPSPKVDNFFESLKEKTSQAEKILSHDTFDDIPEGRPYSTPSASDAGYPAESTSVLDTDLGVQTLSSHNWSRKNEINPNNDNQSNHRGHPKAFESIPYARLNDFSESNSENYMKRKYAVGNLLGNSADSGDAYSNLQLCKATSTRPSSAGATYAPSSSSSIASSSLARRQNVFAVSPPKAPLSNRPKTAPSPRVRQHRITDNSHSFDDEGNRFDTISTFDSNSDKKNDIEQTDGYQPTATYDLSPEELDRAIKLYKQSTYGVEKNNSTPDREQLKQSPRLDKRENRSIDGTKKENLLWRTNSSKGKLRDYHLISNEPARPKSASAATRSRRGYQFDRKIAKRFVQSSKNANMTDDLVIEGNVGDDTLGSTSRTNATTSMKHSHAPYGGKDSKRISMKLLTTNTQPFSPRRPSSAPAQRFGYSPRQRPRFNTRTHTDTGRSKNPFARGSGKVDAYHNVLRHRYRVANRNITTNHQAYGLFVKNLNKVLRYQKQQPGTTGFVYNPAVGSRQNSAR